MYLKIDSNDGLMSAHYAFSFSDEDVKEHLDGIYSAFILFAHCFKTMPTLEQVCFMSFINSFPNFLKYKMDNFVIQTHSFNERYDNDVLALLDKMCDFIIQVKVESAKYSDSIDKDKVISGHPFAKQCALSLKQELKDKKIRITHSYTDPFS